MCRASASRVGGLGSRGNVGLNFPDLAEDSVTPEMNGSKVALVGVGGQGESGSQGELLLAGKSGNASTKPSSLTEEPGLAEGCHLPSGLHRVLPADQGLSQCLKSGLFFCK